MEEIRKYDIFVNGEKIESILRHYDNIQILIRYIKKLII
jgi:hypothetical protein